MFILRFDRPSRDQIVAIHPIGGALHINMTLATVRGVLKDAFALLSAELYIFTQIVQKKINCRFAEACTPFAFRLFKFDVNLPISDREFFS